jgi:LuxR family transcriptional regulator, regulator of acetate metabolism
LSVSVREGPAPVAAGPDGAAALVGVANALMRLGQPVSLAALFAESARAICEEIGFARAAVFSFRDHALELQSVHACDERGCGERVRLRLGAEPVRLGPWLHESEVLRRRTPLLVRDAGADAHALTTLSGVSSYVLAPVTCRHQAVALVHADHGPAGRNASAFDRATLWAFVVGFGHALERTALEERIRRHSERVVALARSTEANAEHLLVAGIEGLPAPLGRIAPNGTSIVAERERLAMLTRREQEVIAMLAEGETNARIAQRLVLSQDTVKTHVKHILRKLGVRNRSQAVSRYYRTRASSELEPPASEVG